MVRGVYINRAPSEKLTVKEAMTRYLAEIAPAKASGALQREASLAKEVLINSSKGVRFIAHLKEGL